MRSPIWRITGTLLAAGALLATQPAGAQSVRPAPFTRPTNPDGTPIPPAPFTRPTAPDGTPIPLAPFTRPAFPGADRPDARDGRSIGIWMPRSDFIGFGIYYGPGFYPPGAVLLPGACITYSSPGFSAGLFYTFPQTVVRREVVILREGRTPAEGPDAPQPPDALRPLRPRQEPEAGRAQMEGLSDALDDIRKAWLNGDYERLKARLPQDGKVRIFPGGRYRYSLDAQEFARLVRDAMVRIDTVAFDFDRPKSEEAGRAFVTGRHVYLEPGGARRETYISYTLERIEGRWRITEAGSSENPISRHEEAPAN